MAESTDEAVAKETKEFFAKMGRAPSPQMVDEAGVTDLHRAGYLNLPALVQSLLDQGADIEAKARIHARISPQYTAALDKMSVRDDEYETENCTPLHCAAMTNASKAAKVLLLNDADINVSDDDGSTPLDYTALVNAPETAEVLLQYRANPNAKSRISWNALHMATISAVFIHARETIEVFLRHGLDVNVKIDSVASSMTLLHCAVFAHTPEIAEILLKWGADVNAEDWEGHTPLHYAEKKGPRETVEVLIRYGGYSHHPRPPAK